MSGAHGEEADFKGVDGGVYNVLSARNMSLNVMVQHDVFNTPHSKREAGPHLNAKERD